MTEGKRLWWQDASENASIVKGDVSRQVGDIRLVKFGAEIRYYELEKDLVKTEHKRTFWERTLLRFRETELHVLEGPWDVGWRVTLGLRILFGALPRSWYNTIDPRSSWPFKKPAESEKPAASTRN